MRVKLWGTRGSIPTPGPDTVEFGGNTSCVEIEAGGETLIFDAGSGIRVLGDALLARGAPLKASVFLTHVHWDHIQGFPFFSPAYLESTVLDIYGLPFAHKKVDLLLSSQMEQTYFPVDLGSLRAKIRFHDLMQVGGACSPGGAEVRTLKVNHTTDTLGFRVQRGGKVAVYMPDNEIGFCAEPGRTSYEELVGFCRDADILIHDAQYTDAIYPRHRGWGHSTREQAVQLALDAGVKRLLAFHHDPRTTDTELAAWELEVREQLAARESPLHVQAARELLEIQL